jgi:membrane protein
VPFEDSPAIRLSLRPVHGRYESLKALEALFVEIFTVRLFSIVGKSHRFTCDASSRNASDWPEVLLPMIDPKGHEASSPAEMPGPAWKDILARTYKRTWDDNVALVSAGVAFYGFFALLSLLGLIVLVYGFVADPRTVIDHMRALTAVLPTDVAVLIGQQLMTAVKSSEGAKGLGILLAFLVATYGGTNGATSVLTALNIAYEEKEKRSLLRFYLLALCLTIGALVVALVAIAATAAVGYLRHLAPRASPGAVIAGKVIGYVLLAFLAALVASILYRVGPSREDAKWKWITPVSLLAALAWLLLSVSM